MQKAENFSLGLLMLFGFSLGGGSYICVCKLDFIIEKELAQLLTTVFSIVFTVLFGFAAVMVSKIDSSEKTEKQVAEETFVSIVSAHLLSLMSAVLSILLTQTVSQIILKIGSIGLLGCWRREIATIFCREYLTNFCRKSRSQQNK